MKFPTFSLIPLCAGLLLTCPVPLFAAPSLFTAEYDTSYGGLSAEAKRSMSRSGEDRFEMSTTIDLKLLGKTVSTIDEHNVLFLPPGSADLRPLEYSFDQQGIGQRSRHIAFDWDDSSAIATVDGRTSKVTLEGNVSDNLSAYLEIKEQLQEGNTEIMFSGIDKNELEVFHYRVIGEEDITTVMGSFHTVKLERVREPGNDRTTEIWLAPEWDYLLVRLIQKEPGSGTISLDLKEATVNNRKVMAIRELATPDDP